jgi:hypothetical protein
VQVHASAKKRLTKTSEILVFVYLKTANANETQKMLNNGAIKNIANLHHFSPINLQTKTSKSQTYKSNILE